MARFRYTAVAAGGDVVRGEIEAADEAEAIASVQRQGHLPLAAHPAAFWRDGLRGVQFGRGAHLSRQDVANVTRELAIMLGAGQDLDRALRFVVTTAPNARIGRVMDRVRAAVRDGAALATALGASRAASRASMSGWCAPARPAGRWARRCSASAVLLERERSLASSVTSALIYPALLTVAAVGAIALLLTQVLPEFVPLFEQNGVALPRPTRILIALGDAVSAYGPSALLVIPLLLLAARQALRRPAPRLLADRLVLRLPLFGGLLREALAARFARTLGTLLDRGMPLVAALQVAREALGNRAAAAAVAAAAQRAKGGGGLATALGETGIFPVRTTHLLQLGEETAQLGAMALRAAEIHEEATRVSVQRLIALLVPAITLLMGAAVAAIVTALLLAMLSLNDLAT